MPKGWETIRTDKVAALPKAQAVKKAKVAAKVTNVKSLSYEDLKKEGVNAYTEVVAREDSILSAAAGNKLQSESLKKEAADISKRRAAAANRKKGKAVDKAD